MAIDVRRLDRDVLDALNVLDALTKNSSLVTYVLRNTLAASWHDYGWTQHLETHQVLAACRRLEARGLVAEAPTSYATYKAWQITEAGRAEHERAAQKRCCDDMVMEDPDRAGWWAYRTAGPAGSGPAVVGGFPTATAARRAAARASNPESN
ncbi:hypothetical protein V5F40_22785 [Xanthobacter sp. DSM 14520]|uniref:hypothetical protein n=1 Tax=Xanthobacter autotrophicus (strain ATCC BAA-1158 / Py2) TaxID=78245 RepID=UPI00372C583C